MMPRQVKVDVIPTVMTFNSSVYSTRVFPIVTGHALQLNLPTPKISHSEELHS
jgi:hypothetical protein